MGGKNTPVLASVPEPIPGFLGMLRRFKISSLELPDRHMAAKICLLGSVFPDLPFAELERIVFGMDDETATIIRDNGNILIPEVA